MDSHTVTIIVALSTMLLFACIVNVRRNRRVKKIFATVIEDLIECSSTPEQWKKADNLIATYRDLFGNDKHVANLENITYKQRKHISELERKNRTL